MSISTKGNLEHDDKEPKVTPLIAALVVNDRDKKVNNTKEMKKTSAHDLKLRAQDICKLDLSHIRKILKEYMNLTDELTSTIRRKDKVIRSQRRVIETQGKIIEKIKPTEVKKQ